ncbi:hypothetical protein CEXT_635391 [Caerostris extrusa]|uniref:Uncharacterized protein n=1 Tax=Caerostris extrusa TaxID=172846 RepID=A0AAV4UBV7_CAEEX|nr:hypothetical protein CEXT_635391 [Caerostris extrusa]
MLRRGRWLRGTTGRGLLCLQQFAERKILTAQEGKRGQVDDYGVNETGPSNLQLFHAFPEEYQLATLKKKNGGNKNHPPVGEETSFSNREENRFQTRRKPRN